MSCLTKMLAPTLIVSGLIIAILVLDHLRARRNMLAAHTEGDVAARHARFTTVYTFATTGAGLFLFGLLMGLASFPWYTTVIIVLSTLLLALFLHARTLTFTASLLETWAIDQQARVQEMANIFKWEKRDE
jgi:hypothetical protein